METKLLPKSIFAEKYEIVSLLGSGGMGQVYRATQIDLGRSVALKVLQPDLVADAELQLRFQREAQALATLSHKHIGMFYQYGVSQTTPFIAMEFVEGQSLHSVLQTEGKLEWKRAVRIAIQICDAMAYAHKAGIVHRDIKPGNLMLEEQPAIQKSERSNAQDKTSIVEESDFVKILDFGLAKILAPGRAELQKLTATGALVGSVQYLSPEICSGKQSDARSDIYSLACVLYELITGTVPHDADNPIGLMHKHITEDVIGISQKLKDSSLVSLDEVLAVALAKNPDQRYQTMEEFRSALQAALEGIRIVPSKAKGAGSKSNATVIATVVIVLLVSGAYVLIQNTGPGLVWYAKLSSRKPANKESISTQLRFLDRIDALGDRKSSRELMVQIYNSSRSISAIEVAELCLDFAKRSFKYDENKEGVSWTEKGLQALTEVNLTTSLQAFHSLCTDFATLCNSQSQKSLRILERPIQKISIFLRRTYPSEKMSVPWCQLALKVIPRKRAEDYSERMLELFRAQVKAGDSASAQKTMDDAFKISTLIPANRHPGTFRTFLLVDASDAASSPLEKRSLLLKAWKEGEAERDPIAIRLIANRFAQIESDRDRAKKFLNQYLLMEEQTDQRLSAIIEFVIASTANSNGTNTMREYKSQIELAIKECSWKAYRETLETLLRFCKKAPDFVFLQKMALSRKAPDGVPEYLEAMATRTKVLSIINSELKAEPEKGKSYLDEFDKLLLRAKNEKTPDAQAELLFSKSEMLEKQKQFNISMETSLEAIETASSINTKLKLAKDCSMLLGKDIQFIDSEQRRKFIKLARGLDLKAANTDNVRNYLLTSGLSTFENSEGMFPEALKHLDEAEHYAKLVNNDCLATVQQFRGVALQGQEDFGGAISAYQKGLALTKSKTEREFMLRGLLDCYQRIGDTNSANSAAEKLGNETSSNFHSLVLLGAYESERANFAKSQEYLDKAIKLAHSNKERASVLKTMGEVAFHKKDYKSAETYSKEAIKASEGVCPEYFDSGFTLLDIYLAQHKDSETEAIAEKMLSHPAINGLSENKARLLSILSQMKQRSGNNEAASSLAREAVAQSEKKKTWVYFSCLNRLGDIQLASGKLKESRASFGKIVELRNEERFKYIVYEPINAELALAEITALEGNKKVAKEAVMRVKGRAANDSTLKKYVEQKVGESESLRPLFEQN